MIELVLVAAFCLGALLTVRSMLRHQAQHLEHLIDLQAKAHMDWARERGVLLNRIQAPQFTYPTDLPDSPPVEWPEEPKDEWHLVGQIVDLNEAASDE